MRISFDIDGVLADFESNAIEVANSIWPGKIPVDYHPTHWDWPDVFVKPEWDRVWEEIKKIPDFWIRQKHYPESIESLRSFLREFPDARIFFVTARITTGGVSARKQTTQWLDNLGLVTKRTTVLISRPEEKIHVMADARIQYSVDDKKETVQACQELPSHKAFLFDQPWNQDSDLPRVYSVKEYTDIIVKYEKQSSYSNCYK